MTEQNNETTPLLSTESQEKVQKYAEGLLLIENEEKQLKKRREDINAESAEVESLAQSLVKKRRALHEEEHDLSVKEKELEQKASAFEESQSKLLQDANALKERSQALEKESALLEEAESHLAEKRMALYEREERLKERAASIEDKENSLSNDAVKRCSFCGKAEADVPFLIAAKDAFICSNCVRTCEKILSSRNIK